MYQSNMKNKLWALIRFSCCHFFQKCSHQNSFVISLGLISTSGFPSDYEANIPAVLSVMCGSLFSRTFNQTVGTFNELQKYLQGYVATLDRDDKKRHAKYVQYVQYVQENVLSKEN